VNDWLNPVDPENCTQTKLETQDSMLPLQKKFYSNKLKVYSIYFAASSSFAICWIISLRFCSRRSSRLCLAALFFCRRASAWSLKETKKQAA